MSGIGDGFQNYRNDRQVTPQRTSSGDREHANEPVNQPANDPVNEPVDGPANQPANEDIGGLRGYMVDLYLALRDICRRLDALIASVLNQYDDYLYDDNYNVNIRNINVRDNNANADNNVNIRNINVRDNNANVDNNVNIRNINVRDNNANADNNEQHEDHNAVVVGGIENEDSDEAFEDCEDVHQYIPEEDPQPGVSRRRSREMDEEDVEPNKRIRWSEEFSDDDSDFFSASDTDSVGCPHAGNIADEDINQQVTEEEPQPGGSTKRSREEDVDEEGRNSKKSRLAHSDSGTSSAVYDHSESSSDELFEDAHEELDNHEAGGSRKRSREDFEEEEEYLPVCKFRRCSNESTSSSDED